MSANNNTKSRSLTTSNPKDALALDRPSAANLDSVLTPDRPSAKKRPPMAILLDLNEQRVKAENLSILLNFQQILVRNCQAEYARATARITRGCDELFVQDWLCLLDELKTYNNMLDAFEDGLLTTNARIYQLEQELDIATSYGTKGVVYVN